MLNNFHLAALAKVEGRPELFRIPIDQVLQTSQGEMWSQQLDEFMKKTTEIDLNMGYNPDEHERFRIKDFTLSDPLGSHTSQNIQDVKEISKQEEAMESIKTIVAFCRDENKTELVLFQNFTKSDVIRPGRFLLLRENTYETVKRPGLTLDTKLAAVYNAKEKKLLFRNFRTTNTFLPLTDFFEEASEEEIKKILKHKSLAPEDAQALAVDANQWMRKRFAMLRDSGLLNDYTPKQIKARSKGYEVDVIIKNGKIVFPSDSGAARKLLHFLNEELYRGPITENLYETNSKHLAG
jgi:hypothetical protein